MSVLSISPTVLPTVVHSIGFGSVVTYPHVCHFRSHIELVLYCTALVPQASALYQMYIVYTIIRLTYSSCLPF